MNAVFFGLFQSHSSLFLARRHIGRPQIVLRIGGLETGFWGWRRKLCIFS